MKKWSLWWINYHPGTAGSLIYTFFRTDDKQLDEIDPREYPRLFRGSEGAPGPYNLKIPQGRLSWLSFCSPSSGACRGSHTKSYRCCFHWRIYIIDTGEGGEWNHNRCNLCYYVDCDCGRGDCNAFTSEESPKCVYVWVRYPSPRAFLALASVLLLRKVGNPRSNILMMCGRGVQSYEKYIPHEEKQRIKEENRPNLYLYFAQENNKNPEDPRKTSEDHAICFGDSRNPTKKRIEPSAG